MAAAPGDLTTLANACTWLGVAEGTDDTTIQRLISAVSANIQEFLGYLVVTAAYSRTFNGRGSRILSLPDRNVTAVASLSIDGINIPLSVNGSSGFLFDDKSIGLVGAYIFCRGYQNIFAAYTAGYSSVPLNYEQACLDWLKVVYATADPDRDVTVSSYKAGDTQIVFGGATGNALGKMPSPVMLALAQLQRVTPS